MIYSLTTVHYVIFMSSDMVLEPAQYGWMMCCALELRTSYTSVIILRLESTTAAMEKTQLLSANVCVSLYVAILLYHTVDSNFSLKSLSLSFNFRISNVIVDLGLHLLVHLHLQLLLLIFV